MNSRLDEIEERYEQLTREMASPEAAGDPARLRELGKLHAELDPIVSTYRAHRDAVRQAEEARAMAKDEKDPEMAQFLRHEEAEADRRAEELGRVLEVLLVPKDPND